MSLLLTLEQGPRSQVVRQTRLDEGELVIGRSADAGWQIDDPDMFVSRAHCKISGGRDGYYVTDTSSSGLFIDDSDSPLGTGRSTRLQSGMRLRMGDYVLHVEVQPSAGHTSIGQAPIADHAAPAWQSPQPRTPPSIGGDDFFSAKVEEEPQRPRPAGLPDPFEQPVAGAYDRASNRRSSPAFDDPFSLDPVATPASNDEPATGRADPFGFGDMPSRNDMPEPAPKAAGFDDFSFGPAATPASGHGADPADRIERPAEKPKAVRPWEIPAQAPEPPAPPPRPVSAPRPSRPTQPAPSDMALRAAFLRGMGVEEADFPGRDAIAEMEKFGREYRLMLDGLMQLLRKRAEEKGSARVAQTVVGSSEVNPLKFLPTVDDVIVTIIAERSPGFLSGEAAISDAVKDLAQHHVRAWRGVQAALRRMIDRFDPAAIEEELKSNSAIGNLLAGGRNAKLWELYQKRHRDIAQSAESSFLGEIGADFRDAYEEE
ncbi:type VI secretion system-associated FHA domain protein TagH [Mesorhizobium sp.]|jgi:type VI secretion system protein ImpI|uniref:type VI secretion system-associated FHA domain protein TagH n=1 Tax=Mesorhizobium sp. TaxID=1871066 RepID=UPI000FE2C53C|nr:type VI secretion system-associated FHA domain protein TagH [Mesorhizobium sp.]RWH68333.1 MAG: type VI secretion system-associated FHA domain protein TagH [Mesorhizobium sp.]RWL25089.1 MAG: type VI secretion system-associated FHA domain protein TagH [Mesorhizobium sp.]RWL27594.1 MAG: type VI secretion system-associated FHA domain protein TagH [Mesorhizobium sp.]RWL36322.1 MAG: type VI secretion system-associated FHA domain protein TagH [Mesorhizobium sp.]RWL53606.1 MAG: type VI secretion sy